MCGVRACAQFAGDGMLLPARAIRAAHGTVVFASSLRCWSSIGAKRVVTDARFPLENSMTCTKHSYARIFDAGRALLVITEQPRPGREECGVYRCPHCHALHLTSDRASANNKWTKRALAAASPTRRKAQQASD